MSFWNLNYMLCLLVSILLTGLIIPKILLIAFRKSLFDEIDGRKIHRGVVPRLGGIAFLPAILFSLCFTLGLDMAFGDLMPEYMMRGSLVPIMFLICALMLIYLVGMADDLVGVRYRAKFIFQITCGVMIAVSGTWIMDMHGFLGIQTWAAWIGWLVTIFVVIYVTNAINLIDGIDGLASGVSAIALMFYSFVFLDSRQYVYAMLCAGSLGALIPFFCFNVFGTAGRHTKIFMGDTGSLTIGMILAFLCIVTFNIPDNRIASGANQVILAIAPLLLPCLDVVRVFLHRVRNGRQPFMPDRCHIHHKFLALGFVQWKALIIILVADSLFILCNMLLASRVGPAWILLGDVVVWTLINILLTHTIRARERALHKKLYE